MRHRALSLLTLKNFLNVQTWVEGVSFLHCSSKKKINKNVTQPFKNDNETATTTFFFSQTACVWYVTGETQGLASWKSRPLPAVISSAAGVRHLSRLSPLTLGRLPRWQPHYSDNSSRLETFLRPLWCAAPRSRLRNVNSWAAGLPDPSRPRAFLRAECAAGVGDRYHRDGARQRSLVSPLRLIAPWLTSDPILPARLCLTPAQQTGPLRENVLNRN